jgi:hypothetical protein
MSYRLAHLCCRILKADLLLNHWKVRNYLLREIKTKFKLTHDVFIHVCKQLKKYK